MKSCSQLLLTWHLVLCTLLLCSLLQSCITCTIVRTGVLCRWQRSRQSKLRPAAWQQSKAAAASQRACHPQICLMRCAQCSEGLRRGVHLTSTCRHSTVSWQGVHQAALRKATCICNAAPKCCAFCSCASLLVCLHRAPAPIYLTTKTTTAPDPRCFLMQRLPVRDALLT